MGLGKRIFIALTLTFASSLCFAQKPVAHFTSDCKILCLGSGTGQIGDNEVGFVYDGTSPGTTTYSWNFTTSASPATSTTQNPTPITFNKAGTYLVTVTATNGGQSSTFTDTIFAINTCSANATVSSGIICPGTCISFKDGSNFRPDTWSWTFPGEAIPPPGDTSYHQNPPSVCYPNIGKFTVNLTASRGANTKCFNQAEFSASIITVKNCPPVVFTINASKTALCKGDCINFTSHITSGTAPFTYSWQFLNGGVAGTSTDSLPKGICYNTIGTNLAATLVVTDAVGKTSSETININVVSCLPTAAFRVLQPVCAGQCITFVDSSSAGSGGSIKGWDWEFQGGSIANWKTNGTPPAVCYTTAGTYTTTLVVTNPSGTSPVFSRQVVVNSCPPTADFSFTPNNFCQNGCVTFTDHSVGGPGGKILTWSWAFQDPGGSANPVIIPNDSAPAPVCYPTPGMYTVTEVVTNASGPSAPFTQTITVKYCPPPLNINFTTSSGQATIPSNDVCRDSCIRITNNTTGATSYLWEFIYKDSTGATHDTTFTGVNPPDAPGAPPNTPPQCFAIPIDTGFIHIILFASSADSTKTLDQLIHVHICSGMFPALKPSQPVICSGDCISFMDETTEQSGTAPPIIWQWLFDGGSPDSSMVQNPPYICYQNPGVYPVKLKVFNGTTSDSVTYNSLIIVNQPAPIGTSFDSTSVVQGTSVQLFASGGVSYAWIPPLDLDDAFSNDPVFTSIDTGLFKYTIQMTDANGCTSTKSIEIDVLPPDLVMAPNVFTPNGDGINDYFKVFISGAYASMELHVYDRWGEQIFSTTNDGDLSGWDGKYKGRPMNDDVYVYYYKVIFKDGTVLKQSGDVTLLR